MLINDVLPIVHFFLLSTSYRRAVPRAGIAGLSAAHLESADLQANAGS
jgi:hypothetical protein